MYKKGIRWTECMETFGRTDLSYMVLGHISIVFMFTLLMLIFGRCSGTLLTRTPSWQTA